METKILRQIIVGIIAEKFAPTMDIENGKKAVECSHEIMTLLQSHGANYLQAKDSVHFVIQRGKMEISIADYDYNILLKKKNEKYPDWKIVKIY